MFAPGELVWAKYDEYPFWPGRISSEETTLAMRGFFGEAHKTGVLFFGQVLTYALVSSEDIVDFHRHFDEFAESTCGEELALAVEMAMKNDAPDPPLELVHEEAPLPALGRYTGVLVLRTALPLFTRASASGAVLKFRARTAGRRRLKRRLLFLLRSYPRHTQDTEDVIKAVEAMETGEIVRQGLFKLLYVIAKKAFGVDPLMVRERVSVKIRDAVGALV